MNSQASSDEVNKSIIKNQIGKYNKEWQEALNTLYAQYSTNPTVSQKIRILEAALKLNANDVYFIKSTADWRLPKEEIKLRNMRYLELCYLEKIGLYKMEY